MSACFDDCEPYFLLRKQTAHIAYSRDLVRYKHTEQRKGNGELIVKCIEQGLKFVIQ